MTTTPTISRSARRWRISWQRGQVVGWFQGRMEFGPRALGSRSILGDARNPQMQSRMNVQIKFRESFRPFAPAVLRDRCSDYFVLRADDDRPYMSVVAPVVDSRRRSPGGDDEARQGFDRLRTVRSDVPAVTHVDYSARVQTVDAARHGRFAKLLRACEAKTGCPVVVNTSFNVRGEPIVRTPDDALRCFMATGMDALVLGRSVLLKDRQPAEKRVDASAHLARFEMD